MGDDFHKEWRELIVAELTRVRQSIDLHTEKISEMREDLAGHKKETSIIALFISAAAGFLSSILK